MTNPGRDHTEALLVLRCQAGDKSAFDELLALLQAPLWRYVSNLTRDPGLAEDILQEVFLIIYRKIGWLNDPKLFRSWAYRIASRETFRMIRKYKSRRDQPLDDTIANHAVGPFNDEPDRELIEKIPAMLTAVPPASRAVLILHYLEELSLSETAAVLDLSTGTVKSRLAYGLECLRRQIADQYI